MPHIHHRGEARVPVEFAWQFDSTGPESGVLTVDVHYQLPGGLAGRALGAAIEPFVAIAVRHTDAKLRQVLEERYRAAGRVRPGGAEA